MDNYYVLAGKENMILPDVMVLLSQTYWANKYDIDTVSKAMDHSLCYGAFSETTGKQIAFARVLTDYVTRYYILDVVVDENVRGEGIAQLLIGSIVDMPELKHLRGLLITKTAEGLYEKFGFETYQTRCMQKPAK